MLYTLYQSTKTFPESIRFVKMVFNGRPDALNWLHEISASYREAGCGLVLDAPALELSIYNAGNLIIKYLLTEDQL